MNYLLVEDDDLHARLVTRCLAQERVSNEVNRVSDGADALAYLRQEGAHVDATTPDVILLDLKLPKLDGLEVLEQIKDDEHFSTIPVVMMTTSDSLADRQRAYRLHVNSYVVKPANFEHLQRMLSDLSSYWGLWNRPSQ